MTPLPRGLYEQLITLGLQRRLDDLDPRIVVTEKLHHAEVPNRMALHLGRQIELALSSIGEDERLQVGLQVAQVLLETLQRLHPTSACESEFPTDGGNVLRAISQLQPDGSLEQIVSPIIPLLDTTLLTNSPGEPRLSHQLVTEIQSAQQIDVVMAFIRRTGVSPMLNALQGFVQRGGRIRVLTTVYTGSTERTALDQLAAIGAQIRVSYDVSTTRLHAKSWLFERSSGFSTAYIGSSNLTHSAQHSGLEWNVRVSGARNPDVLEKIRAVFESYWVSHDFREYDPEEFSQEVRSSRNSSSVQISPLAVELKPFQEHLLEQIALSREQGQHRNLLVAATGTGKTVMAAVDYSRVRRSLSRHRLLFVAHREEILVQSMATFRHVLREPGFGELWTGRSRPDSFENVFASIQSLHSDRLQLLHPKHFDCVVIDEFHHAAAPSYRALLTHIEPVELLALTATPERADGHSILGWFGDRIAAELRLWDAIDQQHLTPFHYFGLHDGVDLSRIPWRRGSGYDVEQLTQLYTASDLWAEFVLREFLNRIPDPDSVRALGFCVSVRHAEYMASIFNRAGVPSTAVSSTTRGDVRQQALRDLAEGNIRALFSVDLFNEGVDVPAVDALLLLRPTESSTLFIQQLGRGLRKRENKTVCTVLDFVGTHRREFRFDLRFRALLGGTRKELEDSVRRGFPYLPAGCHMELDAQSQRIILESIRSALPSRWSSKVSELRAFLEAGNELNLGQFLLHSGLELTDIYSGSKTWSTLCRDAGLRDPRLDDGPQGEVLRKAVVRLLHVDDATRIESYLRLFKQDHPPSFSALRGDEQRLVRMLLFQICYSIDKSLLPAESGADEALALIWRHPAIRTDLVALFTELRSRISHLQPALWVDGTNPLRVHAQYTRAEILGAFGSEDRVRAETWREGVRWFPAEQTDVFLVTLNKTEGRFSPSTRYKDYAISRDLLHWESQSTTSEESPTGLRYRGLSRPGSRVVIFVRLHPESNGFWCLGTARYVRHTGERPMAIIWKLDHPLPGDLFQKFAAAVA